MLNASQQKALQQRALQQTQAILDARKQLLQQARELPTEEAERLHEALDIFSFSSNLVSQYGPRKASQIISNNQEAFRSPYGDYPFIVRYDPNSDTFYYYHHAYPQINGKSHHEAQSFVDTLCPNHQCDLDTTLRNLRNNARNGFTTYDYNWFDPITNEVICKRSIAMLLNVNGNEYLVGSGYTIPNSVGGCQSLGGSLSSNGQIFVQRGIGDLIGQAISSQGKQLGQTALSHLFGGNVGQALGGQLAGQPLNTQALSSQLLNTLNQQSGGIVGQPGFKNIF